MNVCQVKDKKKFLYEVYLGPCQASIMELRHWLFGLSLLRNTSLVIRLVIITELRHGYSACHYHGIRHWLFGLSLSRNALPQQLFSYTLFA